MNMKSRWMRVFRLIGGLVICVGFLFEHSVAAGDEHGDEVVVWFAEGTVTFPSDSTVAQLPSIQFEPADVSVLLQSYGVATMAKAFPSYDIADSVATSRTGELVKSPRYDLAYVLALPPDRSVDSLITDLMVRPEIGIAERVGYPVFEAVYPNDPRFEHGEQYGLNNFGQRVESNSGIRGSDISATGAWSRSQGRAETRIVIIDGGFTTLHPEFQGRIDTAVSDTTWDRDGSGHGFGVAGIVGANANNGIGMSGVDWHATLISKYIPSRPDVAPLAANAVRSSLGYPVRADVMNHSYALRDAKGITVDSSRTMAIALSHAYNSNVVNVAAMGNYNGYPVPREYPAAYPMQMLAVGAIDNRDQPYLYSEAGPHIDVVAPGVRILTTSPFDSMYTTLDGTSFAAAFVTGTVGLLLGKMPSLYNDDVEHLIQLSADDLNPPQAGFDNQTGWGRVNARRALDLLGPPHVMKRGGGSVAPPHVEADSVTFLQLDLSGIYYNPGPWDVTRYHVTQDVWFATDTTGGSFQSLQNLHVWGRGATLTAGWSASSVPPLNYNWCQPVPGTVTLEGCKMETYCYYLPGPRVWLTKRPNEVQCAWTAIELRPVAVPDTLQSYYVPQADVGGQVVEGHDAFRFFRGCPNNDGSSYPSNARIEITVKDANGLGIAGIPASDIYVLLNGGTQAQGFSNEGADSIIASSRLDGTCVDVRAIHADLPTDQAGRTYLTFRGARDGNGQSVRDPSHKWGHTDEELPVFVQGARIRGRTTSQAPPGSYRLELKSFDIVGGLGSLAPFETVSMSDYNRVYNLWHSPYLVETHWWADFDSDGDVDFGDWNMWSQHFEGVGEYHSCGAPVSP